MTADRQAPLTRPTNRPQAVQGPEPFPDPSRCQTEVFIDRDVVLTRCLESRTCRCKQSYLHMAICSCPGS